MNNLLAEIQEIKNTLIEIKNSILQK